MLLQRHYSRESLERNFARGKQRNCWNVLRFAGVPIARYPNIYEHLMGFPTDWTKPI